MTDTCSANWSLTLSFVSTYLSVLPCIDKRHAPNETCFHMHCVFTALNNGMALMHFHGVFTCNARYSNICLQKNGKLFKILNLMSAGLNQFSIPDVISDVTRFFTSLQIFSFHLRDISAKNFQNKKMHKMFHRLNSPSIDSLCYSIICCLISGHFRRKKTSVAFCMLGNIYIIIFIITTYNYY